MTKYYGKKMKKNRILVRFNFVIYGLGDTV